MLSHQSSNPTFGRRATISSMIARRPRRVYYCFDYQRDLERVRRLLDIPNVLASAAAGFQSAAFWERTCRRGDDAVRGMIDSALDNTTITVVCLGRWTANRKFIDYEIKRSLDRGNALMGVLIHHLRDNGGRVDDKGDIPALLSTTGSSVYDYAGPAELANQIEEAARLAGM
jgi:hypothetical protein